MALLTKAQIISTKDREARVIDVPEWGGEVRIMAVTPAIVREVKESAPKKGEDDTFGYRIMTRSIVDDDGLPIFDLADVAELEKKSAAALKRVMDAINDLNGWNQKAEEAGNDSAPTTSGASSTD